MWLNKERKQQGASATVMPKDGTLLANPATDKLALYHYEGCPFCSIVMSRISSLGVDVEFHDIYEVAQNCEDLINARGRAAVPVLKIKSVDGGERWMPESRDIDQYLVENYS